MPFSCLLVSTDLVLCLCYRAHPECVPELLEEGIMQDLLQLLLHCFQSGAQEEVKLQVRGWAGSVALARSPIVCLFLRSSPAFSLPSHLLPLSSMALAPFNIPCLLPHVSRIPCGQCGPEAPSTLCHGSRSVQP